MNEPTIEECEKLNELYETDKAAYRKLLAELAERQRKASEAMYAKIGGVEAIARAMLQVRPGERAPSHHWIVWNNAVIALAAELKTTNPCFDKAYFIRACNGEPQL